MSECKFSECGRDAVTRGWCNAHYQQFRQGKPVTRLRKKATGPLLDRFYSSIQKTDGCWVWTGSIHSRGYGYISFGGRKNFAHRVSYEIHTGPIPKGLVIDHRCRNKLCVNPEHLQAVTNKENGENLDKPRPWNVSGVRGVNWYPRLRKWRGRVGHYGESHHIGFFDTVAEAEAAVVEARNQLHVNNLVDRV